MASDDDVERQTVVLYKVGTVWVQGQSLETRHIWVHEVVIFSID